MKFQHTVPFRNDVSENSWDTRLKKYLWERFLEFAFRSLFANGEPFFERHRRMRILSHHSMKHSFRFYLWLIVFLSALPLSLFAQVTSRIDGPGAKSTARSGEESRQKISKSDVQKSFLEIESFLQNENTWPQAESKYDFLLKQDLSIADREVIQKALEHLRMKTLFSKVPTPDSLFYAVSGGDSLNRIAKKYHTTAELIQKANGLKNSVIRPGMKLKITKARFHVQVDKSENKLRLFVGDKLLKTYSVATGKNNSTPVGTFTIENKLIDPVWYKTGAVIPSGSPDNILGTRWLGFSLAGYGIHGTTLPETIGMQASDGCVRMHNEDVEELFDIVPLRTVATVVD